MTLVKLMTKARDMERCEPRMQPGSHIDTPRSAKEGEGLSPHIHKWAPTSGVGVPRDFQIFRK
jgi:hypothetical protein